MKVYMPKIYTPQLSLFAMESGIKALALADTQIIDGCWLDSATLAYELAYVALKSNFSARDPFRRQLANAAAGAITTRSKCFPLTAEFFAAYGAAVRNEPEAAHKELLQLGQALLYPAQGSEWFKPRHLDAARVIADRLVKLGGNSSQRQAALQLRNDCRQRAKLLKQLA